MSVHSRIGARRDHPLREPAAIQIPDRSLVPVEGAQPLAILGPPHRRDVILRPREEEVAVEVELDDRDGPLVSLEQNRPLRFDTTIGNEV